MTSKQLHDRVYAQLPNDPVQIPLILHHKTSHRFVKPAAVHPLQLKRLEIDVLQIAETHSFTPIQLSPVAPLGSCSVIAPADQNKVISALRGAEVVADATNLMAMHVCDGLKSGLLDNRTTSVKFSTTHRHVRAQNFKNAPGMLPHFHVFCMVSSGRDQGSYSFEKSSFWDHIEVYREIFQSLYQSDIEVVIGVRNGYADSEGLVHRIALSAEGKRVPVTVNSIKRDNPYYKGMQFTISTTIQ